MAAALGPGAVSGGPALPIVAEDLGLVTPEVEALRRGLGLPGMRILQFAFGGDGGHAFLPHNCPPDSVVYTGTHDNDTVQGWWANAPARERAYCAHLLRVAPEAAAQELHWAMIQAACQSPARWAVFPLQDVLGLPGSERVNHPGTLGGDNWRWRVEAGALTDAVAARLAGLAAGSGRAPIDRLRLPQPTAPQGAARWVAPQGAAGWVAPQGAAGWVAPQGAAVVGPA
jgi:4-alpha-glucanotransferase